MLGDLGIGEDSARRRLLEVWNKIDMLESIDREEVSHAAGRLMPSPVLVSAVTGEGVDDLLGAIEDRLGSADQIVDLTLPATAGKLAHWLHENAEILTRETAENGETRYQVRVDAARKARLEAQLRRL